MQRRARYTSYSFAGPEVLALGCDHHVRRARLPAAPPRAPPCRVRRAHRPHPARADVPAVPERAGRRQRVHEPPVRGDVRSQGHCTNEVRVQVSGKSNAPSNSLPPLPPHAARSRRTSTRASSALSQASRSTSRAREFCVYWLTVHVYEWEHSSLPHPLCSPGCGKTLAVQTVVENMKGASSPMPLFRMLPNLQQMPYQCSESSTASEVAAVFDNAVSRARAMRQHHDIILVFLDVSCEANEQGWGRDRSIFTVASCRRLVFRRSAARPSRSSTGTSTTPRSRVSCSPTRTSTPRSSTGRCRCERGGESTALSRELLKPVHACRSRKALRPRLTSSRSRRAAS